MPFSTPEAITVHIASQRELRNILKHCITVLSAAPNQLQAVMQELQEVGADDLVQLLAEELDFSFASPINPHLSQHKDHAHKKLRHCLQQQSSNLTVTVALRLTMYTTKHSSEKNIHEVDIQTLAQNDLANSDVRKGLQELTTDGLLDWHGEEKVQLTSAQLKRLSRFYKEE
ncbi:hypothetical protein KDW_24730 [Dictyobacter vulcani]|uniref:Uncharacterized protein n=1 Tax=Dictyobacter vulcani TaxID=2607529 RepID=A0A5J4KPL7_9CHLR|nr:hypothetical protein [Dictyobacter vulcani]GER88311.1 hypothetical protein KDW_24730 [Dictyobacter vulcani]